MIDLEDDDGGPDSSGELLSSPMGTGAGKGPFDRKLRDKIHLSFARKHYMLFK
jgi:hypothetical protein